MGAVFMTKGIMSSWIWSFIGSEPMSAQYTARTDVLMVCSAEVHRHFMLRKSKGNSLTSWLIQLLQEI